MTNHGEQEWVEEEVEVARPVGVVVSVRIPQELAERLYAAAKRRGVKASAVLRDALEAYLADGGARAATAAFTVTAADAPVAFYTSRPRDGRTASTAPEPELVTS